MELCQQLAMAAGVERLARINSVYSYFTAYHRLINLPVIIFMVKFSMAMLCSGRQSLYVILVYFLCPDV